MSSPTSPTSPIASIDFSETISSEFGIFGLPFTEENSALVLFPVPWEVTTSYGKGASLGPQIIREASVQVDLFDFDTGKAYEHGYFMKALPKKLLLSNRSHKILAQKIISMRTKKSKNQKQLTTITNQVNKACQKMTDWVYTESKKILNNGKLLGLIGGDHSTPLGAIRALSEKYSGEFGILHIDAHADLRKSYQGFLQSHASIMYNVMTDPLKPQKLVQIGIRDFCEEEYLFIQSRKDIKTFFDQKMKTRLMGGESWKRICLDILNELPEKVYISFDIDGLDPQFCPHTGTPVPGGLSIDQIFYLFNEIGKSGRQIIGFDLNEVSSGGGPVHSAEWDANVGARVLYKLCGWTVHTNLNR